MHVFVCLHGLILNSNSAVVQFVYFLINYLLTGAYKKKWFCNHMIYS